MSFLHFSAYQFVTLTDLSALRDYFFQHAQQLALKGTILLSAEGINLNLSGVIENSQALQALLLADVRFSKISFREQVTDKFSFQRLKVKIKKEIITLRQPDIHPEKTRAPSITPTLLKQWLDEQREMTLLDTRNEYEIQQGSFVGAINPHIQHFTEFPIAAANIQRDKPIVMFCTGGIRCEKAALYMLQQGFNEVYQLEGGILNYFAEVGEKDKHYQGGCFVFDEREVV
ncbi:MAG TPA: rhodanese-like domain-containing protein [Gammaproteobacteria bacterium]|nr:rhodanese-like domain-containing protein [Gammaproteobacteria bacterium]